MGNGIVDDLIAVATVGTTLAPWGLTFIQSYAVDKHLEVKDIGYERIDVIVGAVLTGVIGVFVVVASAATLHVGGISIDDASDAAQALEPLAGHLAAMLFGLGFLGASLLAAAVVPLSTAYSTAEAFEAPGDIDDHLREAPVFYGTFMGIVAIAAAIVLIPGAPLIPILFLSQALNAVLSALSVAIHAPVSCGSRGDGHSHQRRLGASPHRSGTGPRGRHQCLPSLA